MSAEEFRCGYAALLGKPNAGKSTLVNTLLGVKLAAVSGLPQTTRELFLGIYSDDRRQIVLTDLPGMVGPTDKLNATLRLNVLSALRDTDVVVFLADIHDSALHTPDVEEALASIRQPMIAAVTKLDGKKASANPRAWLLDQLPRELTGKFTAILGISSQEQRGLEPLLEEISRHLPEGPPLHDPEDLTDRNMRFLAQEIIREKIFQFLHQELPYAVAVMVEEFKERAEGKWLVSAIIYVEKDSQKGMVIGKSGQMLKRISLAARKDIEDLCQHAIFLDLRVKVRPNWRKNDKDLREFGFLE